MELFKLSTLLRFGILTHFLVTPPKSTNAELQWFMIDDQIFNRPCSQIALCYYLQRQLLKMIISISDSDQEPGRLEKYYPSKDHVVKWAKALKKIVIGFAKSELYMYAGNFRADDRPDCIHSRLKRCEEDLKADVYDQCLENMRINYKRYFWRQRDCSNTKRSTQLPFTLRNLNEMEKVYFGQVRKTSIDTARAIISRYYPDEWVYHSHGYQLRLLNTSQVRWREYERIAHIKKQNSYCHEKRGIYCVLREPPVGDMECYDKFLKYRQCMGSKWRGVIRFGQKYGDWVREDNSWDLTGPGGTILPTAYGFHYDEPSNYTTF